MLVLSRRSLESIMIGDDIEVVLLDIREKSAKIGIVAPKKITVHRKEIYLSIQNENVEASMASRERVDYLRKFLDNPDNENKKLSYG